MKFFIVLVILLVGEQSPRVMKYQYATFTEIETCDLFMTTSQDSLKQSIENQFGVQNIKDSAIACMTQDEINKIVELLEDKTWPEQKHI